MIFSKEIEFKNDFFHIFTTNSKEFLFVSHFTEAMLCLQMRKLGSVCLYFDLYYKGYTESAPVWYTAFKPV